MVYQALGTASDARRFPAPGRIVDAGSGRLHVDSTGQGPVTVVFEAGIAATSLSWKLVQPEVAKFARAVSYDRAGLGWSAPLAGPCGIGGMVEQLRRGLADFTGPRILVAHSFGALIAIAYAAQHPQEIRGLVLVDPVGLSEWASPSETRLRMLRRGIFLARCGRLLARLGVVRLALNLLAGGARLGPHMIARVSSGRRGAAFLERMVGEVRKLPPQVWPMIQAHWSDPKCFAAMAWYLKILPESAASVARMWLEAPVTVLSAENATAQQRADYERLAGMASRGRLEIVERCGHWVQLDRPEAVIHAIREMAGTG
jgi:pimeloyl-ACP methyl ester carboxylesterase